MSTHFIQPQSAPVQQRCTTHPSRTASAYCRVCNRPACADCALRDEYGPVCVDCAEPMGKPARQKTDRQFFTNVLTLILISINVVMFVAQNTVPGFFNALSLSPQSGETEPWRLLTSAFLHVDIWHVGMNMMTLFFIGSGVERALGHLRFLSIYFLSALVGSLAVVAWAWVEPNAWTQVTVGASGAIYGLFGAAFLVQRRSRMPTLEILGLLGVNLAYSFLVPGISWQAHVGGLAGGLIATAAFLGVFDATQHRGKLGTYAWNLLTFVGLTALTGTGFWFMYGALA